jgi:hypothetical protein
MADQDSSSARELIPLSLAAAHALARLVPAHIARSPGGVESLNLVAIEICALVPVYRRDSPSGEPRRITKADLAAGKLALDASSLLVTRADAETAGEKLVAEYVGTKPPVAAPSSEGRKKHL